jgi:hypothetical protein
MAKIVLFDIEATNLNADFGRCLCVAWKLLGSPKVNCVSVLDDMRRLRRDPTDDKHVVERAAAVLADADVWVTWYGQRFDVPFLQSRLIYHGLAPLPPVPHVDGWRIAKDKMHIHSNRLASVSAFLGLDEKTPLKPPIWVSATAGNPKAIRYVIEHCLQDVRVLDEVYRRISPLRKGGPSIATIDAVTGACPICGAVHALVEKGTETTPTRRYVRYQCASCGAWTRGTKAQELPTDCVETVQLVKAALQKHGGRMNSYTLRKALGNAFNACHVNAAVRVGELLREGSDYALQG